MLPVPSCAPPQLQRKLQQTLPLSELIHSKGFSAPISPLESAVTDSRANLRISFKINDCQVLYNQHLRVFSSQVLYNQHLHKNMGGGGYPRFSATVSPTTQLATRLPRRSIGDECSLRVPPAPSTETWSERRARHSSLACLAEALAEAGQSTLSRPCLLASANLPSRPQDTRFEPRATRHGPRARTLARLSLPFGEAFVSVENSLRI